MRRVVLVLVSATGLLCLVLLLLIGLAPASWLDYALQQGSQGTLMLGDAKGRVLSGSGVVQAILPRGEAVTLSPVRWRLRFAGLMAGRLRLVVVSTRTDRPILDISLSPEAVNLHEARLEAPASLLGALSPTLREADLDGQLILKAQDLSLARQGIQGQSELIWHDAASSLAPVRPLGSYRLTLSGAGKGLTCQLVTLTPTALTLEGNCRWQVGQRPDFTGTASPAETQRQLLVPLLRIIGREIRPGVYQLLLDSNVGVV